MITMGSHIATSVTKLTVTPPSGQSGGPCVWFVYEKGDGASKEDVLTQDLNMEKVVISRTC